MALSTPEDIVLVYSGGVSNTNPNKSLGGEPSIYVVQSGFLNNLFDDITPQESEEGVEDYRCVYFVNDGQGNMYNIILYLEDYNQGASVYLGANYSDEVQKITIDGKVTGGNMELEYGGINFVSNYKSNLSEWSQDLEYQLNNLVDSSGNKPLSGVSVTASQSGNYTIFEISFLENDGKRNHPLIKVVDNNFDAGVVVLINKIIEGGPVNEIAPQIPNELTPPGNINFYNLSKENPMKIPLLKPGERFPIWIKRTVNPGTKSVANDGTKIIFSAETISY